MTWILIAVFYVYAGSSGFSAEFNSHEACDNAVAHLQADRRGTFWCFPKGTIDHG